MKRDQKPSTRLNAELAFQYARGPQATPGRGSRTDDELAQQKKKRGEIDGDVVEGEAEVEQAPEQATAEAELDAEPKKSLFELPRKEPARPSLLPDAPAPAAPSAATDGPATTKRRG